MTMPLIFKWRMGGAQKCWDKGSNAIRRGLWIVVFAKETTTNLFYSYNKQISFTDTFLLVHNTHTACVMSTNTHSVAFALFWNCEWHRYKNKQSIKHCVEEIMYSYSKIVSFRHVCILIIPLFISPHDARASHVPTPDMLYMRVAII